LTKATGANNDPHSTIFGLIETIDRLGLAHQERMLRIVSLLADSPAGVQSAAQQMLGRFLDNPPQSIDECLAEMDALIAFLESTASRERYSRDTPGSAGPVRVAAAFRYN
jgi:hypothetical protein